MSFLNRSELKDKEPIKLCPEMELVVRTITIEKQRNRPLEAVVLSRWKFDRLEQWLVQINEEYNLIDYDVRKSPFFWQKVEIRRCKTDSMEAIVPVYRNMKYDKDAMMSKLDQNAELFNINTYKPLDQAYKHIKSKHIKSK